MSLTTKTRRPVAGKRALRFTPHSLPSAAVSPLADAVLQRKPTCACGGACPECQSVIPPNSKTSTLIHSLKGNGQPLPTSKRAFFESRIGADFSQVRLHTGSNAAQAAKSVSARAFTLGNDVVFGPGQYQPDSHAGKSLLAHELAHVVQQGHSIKAKQRSDQILRRSPGPSTITAPPPTKLRGKNPGVCMGLHCRRLTRRRNLRSERALFRLVRCLLRVSLKCLNESAASNASHHVKIKASAEKELRDESANFIKTFKNNAKSKHKRRRAVWWLRKDCERKSKEVELEFRYNVVFESPVGGPDWGDWVDVENALAALPDKATWLNPKLLRFQRAKCDPKDVDANGECKNTIGGRTDIKTSKIKLYNAGLGQQPYSRSTDLGLPGLYQTIRHEVGHVIANQIPKSDRRYLFHNVMDWHSFSWAWVNAPPAYPSWKAQRDRLKRELGYNNSRLRTWLASIILDKPEKVRSRTYIHSKYNKHFLHSIRSNQTPTGEEFKYARSRQEEYLAEIYALAVSRPEFLHLKLSQQQIDWLKKKVFHFPVTMNELARLVALREPMQTKFLRQAIRKFTWKQLNDLLRKISIEARKSGSRVV